LWKQTFSQGIDAPMFLLLGLRAARVRERRFLQRVGGMVHDGLHITKIDSQRASGGGGLLSAAVACWAIAIAFGMAMLWRHGLTAGPEAKPEQKWPVAMLLPPPARVPTLIMTVHPQCPCSRASVNELDVLMSHYPGKVHAYVLFAEPGGVRLPPQSSDLWKSASQIPGVKVMVDNDAAMTRLLGAQTSGQVFVYDAAGVLRFSGGLTGSRGHEGDNDGLTAVEAIVGLNSMHVKSTPVYGCRIW
jgi:hypothetical protein